MTPDFVEDHCEGFPLKFSGSSDFQQY